MAGKCRYLKNLTVIKPTSLLRSDISFVLFCIIIVSRIFFQMRYSSTNPNHVACTVLPQKSQRQLCRRLAASLASIVGAKELSMYLIMCLFICVFILMVNKCFWCWIQEAVFSKWGSGDQLVGGCSGPCYSLLNFECVYV